MPEFKLPVARFRFNLRAETPIQFPAYAGSTWRGVFGHALRRTVCVTRQPECTGCLLQRSCVYSAVFESPAGHGPLLEKVTAAPHPYVLHPLATSGQRYAAGSPLQVRMTLIGNAIGHLPYLIHALQQAGGRGLGKEDGLYGLLAVEQEAHLGAGDWQTIHKPSEPLQALSVAAAAIPPAPQTTLHVHFHTPYRAIQDGKLLRSGRFSFQPFMMGVVRRVSLLQAYHAGLEMEGIDFRTLSEQAAAVPVLAADLHWHDWARYSNRQQAKVPMGGLLGSFQLPAEAAQPFWPWLWLGQWVHVGKGAVMGLGEYTLSEVGIGKG